MPSDFVSESNWSSLRIRRLEQARETLERQVGHLQEDIWRKQIYIAALERMVKEAQEEERKRRENAF